MVHNSLPSRHYFSNFFILLMFILLTSCSYITAENTSLELDLQKTIKAYYELEKENNWSETYKYRDDRFKMTVSADLYIETMKNDNRGWQLLDFKIVSVTKKDSVTIVKIKFTEKVPKDFVLNNKHISTFDIEQDTIWIKVNDKWYCQGAGSRLHLSLNSEIS